MAENYRALTRKYRPRTFDDIVSQEHVSSTLKNAIEQNRLSHAYMFTGPRGVGKTTMARVLARTLNDVDNNTDGEDLGATLNIIEIDAASNNSVEDVRALRERVRIPPQSGRYKIYIIDEVHMLSKQAFNALLKTLEEPPEHVIFIFATTEPHKVLPTILSRVQRFDFKRISTDEMVEHLRLISEKEQITIDEESLHVIAKKADGALRDALGLMDQAVAFCGMDIEHEELLKALNVVSSERMFQLMEHVKNHDASGGLALLHEVLYEGHDIQEFLNGLLEHLRNLYVAGQSQQMHLIESSEEMKNKYKQHAASFSAEDLMRMMHLISDAQVKLKQASQPRVLFEITVLKLIHMERSEQLNQLMGELQALKKKLSEGASLSQESAEPDSSQKQPSYSDAAASEATAAKNGTNHQVNEAGDSQESVSYESGKNGGNGASTDRPAARKEGPEKDSGSGNGREKTPDKAPSAPHPAGRSNGKSRNDFLGKPSLGKGPQSAPAKPADSEAATASAEQVQKSQASSNSPSNAQEEPAPPKEVELHDIQKVWRPFLDELRQKTSNLLYQQLLDCEPVSLQRGKLRLRCNHGFADQMIQENRTDITKILNRNLKAKIRIDTEIRTNQNDTSKRLSPYQRFQQLQQEDPVIRSIVGLFGAELKY